MMAGQRTSKQVVDDYVDKLKPGSTFETPVISKVFGKSKKAISPRKISGYLKARIRHDQNPDGDLEYDPASRKWKKLAGEPHG